MMRWPHAEYILKGVFLGLLLFAGLHEADWRSLGLVALCTVAGFALFLSIRAYRRVREGYRARGRVFSFILFLILESPALVYLGILTGMVAGAATVMVGVNAATVVVAVLLGPATV